MASAMVMAVTQKKQVFDFELQRGSGEENHYRFHPRVWDHNGCVVDIGCSGWDWSSCFLGKKRLIGCDPAEESVPVGAELFRGFIGNFQGEVFYQNHNPNRASAFIKGECRAEMITLEELILRFNIPAISLLKMNIEGMEYDLLIHFPKPIADQIVVSFHDYPRAKMGDPRATRAVLEYLSQWYEWFETSPEWSWYVLLRRQ